VSPLAKASFLCCRADSKGQLGPYCRGHQLVILLPFLLSDCPADVADSRRTRAQPCRFNLRVVVATRAVAPLLELVCSRRKKLGTFWQGFAHRHVGCLFQYLALGIAIPIVCIAVPVVSGAITKQVCQPRHQATGFRSLHICMGKNLAEGESRICLI